MGLNEPKVDLPFSPCIEIGWRLMFDYWGKGLATEAARKGFTISFNILNFQEIVAFTVLANLRSQRVMRNLGMQTKKSEDFNHPVLSHDNALCKHCLYRMTAKEWHFNNIVF